MDRPLSYVSFRYDWCVLGLGFLGLSHILRLGWIRLHSIVPIVALD